MISSRTMQAIKTIRDDMDDAERPFMLFDLDEVIMAAKRFQEVSANYFGNVEVALSVKSCSLGRYLQAVAELGYSAEACSLEEIKIAVTAGFPYSRILFDGPLKYTAELEYAIQNGIRVQADSIEELERIASICTKLDLPAEIAMRLTHMYQDNIESRFGVTEHEYKSSVIPILNNNPLLILVGFHIHTGSNQTGSQKISSSLRALLPFLIKHLPTGGYLDLGSGFPADSFNADTCTPTPSAAAFFEDVKLVLQDNWEHTQRWKLIFEPGRCLSEDHGYYCGKVFSQKNRYGGKTLQCNLAINLIPSMHRWHHTITPLEKTDSSQQEAQALVGFNCFEGDVISHQVSSLGLTPGDYFVIKGCGSYDLQTGAEWTRSRPVVFILEAGKTSLARPSGTADQFVNRERFSFSDRIEASDSIVLSTPTPLDAHPLFDIIADHRDVFSKHMAWPKYVSSAKDTATFLASCVLDQQRGISKTYVVNHNGAACGMVSFNSIDSGNRTAYLGYWLSPDYQRKGIISAALDALIARHLDNNEIHRFVIKCAVDNSASNRVAIRCGFSHEGVLRKAELLNGVFHDQNIYGLTRQEGSKQG